MRILIRRPPLAAVALRLLIAGICAPFVLRGIEQLIAIFQMQQDASTELESRLIAGSITAVVQIIGAGLVICCRGRSAALGSALLITFALLSLWIDVTGEFAGASTIARGIQQLLSYLALVSALMLVGWGHERSRTRRRGYDARDAAVNSSNDDRFEGPRRKGH